MAIGMNAVRGPELLRDYFAPLGVTVGGDGPVNVEVHDDRFYSHAIPRGGTGILDAYVEGWWDCDLLDEATARVLRNDGDLTASRRIEFLARAVAARVTNRQTRRRSLEIRRHYDIGNDLYSGMLDRRMNYSCGYWAHAETLDDAQEAKLDLICRKLQLTEGMRVLDIGCGWGGFAGFAAERYGVSVVGITLSHPQADLATERCAALPVEIRVQDYRDVDDGPYDAVLSIGMFEHVGYKNYRTYFDTVRRLLKPQGLTLLHTIGSNRSSADVMPWINDNIFPNSMLPSAAQITDAYEGLFVLEDWHSFGPDYDRTLMEWYRNFDAAWPELREKYGDRFYRMWRAYLLTCAGSFRARQNQLWQLVLSPEGVPGEYRAPR